MHRRENLVVCGPSGTGETFLLEALGQHAVEQGMRVAWFTLENLGVLLRRHRADTVTKAIANRVLVRAAMLLAPLAVLNGVLAPFELVRGPGDAELDHHATGTRTGERHQAGEDRSLTQGTAAWARLGQPSAGQPSAGQPSQRRPGADGTPTAGTEVFGERDHGNLGCL